jgi:hypothetical protein
MVKHVDAIVACVGSRIYWTMVLGAWTALSPPIVDVKPVLDRRVER